MTREVRRVLCEEGVYHRVIIGGNGHIATPDHGHLSAEIAAARLADDPNLVPRCIRIVLALRAGDRRTLPGWLRARAKKRDDKIDHPSPTLHERLDRWREERWTEDFYRPARLRQCSHWHELQVNWGTAPDVEAWTTVVDYYQRKWPRYGSVHRVTLVTEDVRRAREAGLHSRRGAAILGLDAGGRVHFAVQRRGTEIALKAMPLDEWLKEAGGGKAVTVHEVACDKSVHRIAVSPRGRIALLDHGNLSAELAAAEMGGNPPICVEFVRLLRCGEWNRLPTWARSLRRPDREGRRRRHRIVVNGPKNLRWLADKWSREALPPLLEEVASCYEIAITFSSGSRAWTYRPPSGIGGTVYIDINPQYAHAALRARLPHIKGRAVLGLDGRNVHYASSTWGGWVCYPYPVPVETWMMRARGKS